MSHAQLIGPLSLFAASHRYRPASGNWPLAVELDGRARAPLVRNHQCGHQADVGWNKRRQKCRGDVTRRPPPRDGRQTGQKCRLYPYTLVRYKQYFTPTHLFVCTESKAGRKLARRIMTGSITQLADLAQLAAACPPAERALNVVSGRKARVSKVHTEVAIVRKGRYQGICGADRRIILSMP